MAVSAQDIVDSAYKLKGAHYRFWSAYLPLPMWLNDVDEEGNPVGNPPPADYLVNGPGVMCADLVSWAMMDNGLRTVYGTGAFESFLINTQDFVPSDPGQPGAIAYDPFINAIHGQQGHIAIYVDEHTLIQSLTFNGTIFPGVTDEYDDITTYNWGGDTVFTKYGFLPGVTY